MINIDFLTLKAFLNENIDFIIGARVQKIQQPTRRDFILNLRNYSENKKLYINIMPNIYHICFINKESELKRNIQIPQNPPMFCMLLRKYLDGAIITDACTKNNDRILELHFDIVDEYSCNKSLCLTVELMGKHSNVILYDRNDFIIIGCAHNVGSEKSRYRELKGGLKYIYPPHSGEIRLSDELKVQFNNISDEKIKYYLSTEEYRPAIKDDKYTLFAELLPSSNEEKCVNSMLDNYYSEYQLQFMISSLKNKLFEVVNSKYKKVTNSLLKIKNNENKYEKANLYKKYGELITSNLYLKSDYIKNIKLFDYEKNEDVLIPLDSAKTMSENAQNYFKLYSKSKNAKEKALEFEGSLNIKKNYLESLMYSIESASSMNELKDIEIELGINNTDNKQNKQIHNEIMKVRIKNFDVYIGKNNKQNDYIVSKLSKDNDYWFHTHNCAGSHVLLQVRENEPDESVIFECAKLARIYSSAKQPSKVGVIYTKRKYVKKPPSSPLGYVTYKNETEILI